MSKAGARAQVRATRPSEWLGNVSAELDCWLIDPALVDAAAQMALVWARTLNGQSCLPARFDRVARLSETLPARLSMEFEHVPTGDPYLVRANVQFIDESTRRVVLAIEGMECIASAALNRLGGTAGKTSLALPA